MYMGKDVWIMTPEGAIIKGTVNREVVQGPHSGQCEVRIKYVYPLQVQFFSEKYDIGSMLTARIGPQNLNLTALKLSKDLAERTYEKALSAAIDDGNQLELPLEEGETSNWHDANAEETE